MLKAISQLFPKKNNPEALSDYPKWRNGIFTVTGTQVNVLTDKPNQVYGVIMDVGLSDDFIITVTAFATGESSVRTTIGGGIVGLGVNNDIAKHAKKIVSLAQPLITSTRLIDNHNLPKASKVYFYFLTTSGIMLNESTIEEVDDQTHLFHEVFRRFTVIKTRSEELTKASKK